MQTLTSLCEEREGGTADMPAVVHTYRSARILPEIYTIFHFWQDELLLLEVHYVIHRFLSSVHRHSHIHSK